jgi:hypothetical protein
VRKCSALSFSAEFFNIVNLTNNVIKNNTGYGFYGVVFLVTGLVYTKNGP